MTREPVFVDLIRRVRHGEEGAASELARLYEPAIRRIVRVQMRDPRLRGVLDSTDVCRSVLSGLCGESGLGQDKPGTPQELLGLLTRLARTKLGKRVRRWHAEQEKRQTLSGPPGDLDKEVGCVVE